MKIRIETQSPLHIGSGNTLSPFTDYVYMEGTVYYIDHNALENYFATNIHGEKIMEDFIDIIRGQAKGSMQNRHNLGTFFEKHGLDIEDFSRYKIGSKEPIKEEVKAVVLSKGSPYIPGSSLKGAIRTALLYKHKKDTDVNIKNMGRAYSGSDVFGNINDDVMKHIHVSDSQPFGDKSLEILRLVRYDLVKKTGTIPIVAETVKQFKDTSCTIQLKAKKEIHKLDSKFEYLYGGEDGQSIFLHYVNLFYIDCLENEIKRLKLYSSSTIRPVLEFYNQLLEDAKILSQDRNGAILRLGAGKTYFENSLGNLFSEDQLREIFKNDKRVNTKCFPRTRVITSNNYSREEIPMGWVKILKD